MIVKPIIPIWLMTIICLCLLILIVWDKLKNKKKDNKLAENKKIKKSNKKTIIEIIIVIFLFVINLRVMIPDGEVSVANSDLNVMFVIDKSVSMRALDYDGNKERFEGVINDCCYIVQELSGCKFSIITFGDTAQKLIPFTTDGDMVQAELKAIQIEDDFYASGTSINLVNSEIEKALKKESDKGNSKTILFFITDGEITKEGEVLESFSNIKQYVIGGAVLGYGTTNGGKMVNSTYEDNIESNYYYLYYYDENYDLTTAVSKIDENNLRKISEDISIDYIHMSKTSNVDYKINEIKKQINDSLSNEEKIASYKDIYYLFAIFLELLLLMNFIEIRRKIL
jgi:Ca-activated chloride channel family protein